MQLPTDQEINAKAVELGLADDAGNVRREHRSRVATIIMHDATESAAAPPEMDVESTLLSRTVTKIDGGHIVVEVTLITN